MIWVQLWERKLMEKVLAIDYQADENNPEADNQLNKAIETLQGEMQ